MMISVKERLEIEIELLEWLFEKARTPIMQEQYFYAFSEGVLEEKIHKLKIQKLKEVIGR